MTAATATNNTAPMTAEDCHRIYWHRELPPLDANIMGEHVLEATSGRVRGTLAHRDELWDRCYRDLLANTRERFTQEIDRLGGRYAHVLDENRAKLAGTMDRIFDSQSDSQTAGHG